jgi:hypothetical protein
MQTIVRGLALVAIALAQEPEDAAWAATHNGRVLQSHGGHSSGGHGGGGYTPPPDKSKTGCTVADPSKTAMPADAADAVNEPCYVHDAVCENYPVCCVTKGTCKSTHGGMVSSNAKYYEGGCWSLDSSKTAHAKGCTKQGECNAMYLEHMKGGKTKAGNKQAESAYVVDRMMAGRSGCDAHYSPPLSIGVIVGIAVGAVVGLGAAGFLAFKLCKKAPAGKAGAPPVDEVAA